MCVHVCGPCVWSLCINLYTLYDLLYTCLEIIPHSDNYMSPPVIIIIIYFTIRNNLICMLIGVPTLL